MYEPTKRFTAIEGLIHPWFDELRAGNLVRLDEAGNEIEGEWALRMPNGREVTVPLFDFSREGTSGAVSLWRDCSPYKVALLDTAHRL